MKKSILFLLLTATVLLGKGQATDSTNTIDWCAIFNRVERSGELATNISDTSSHFYCGCKYYIVISQCDTVNPIQEANCSETNLKFVKIEEIFFCNISNYNRVTEIKFKKKQNLYHSRNCS